MDSDDSLSDCGPGTSADGDTTLDTDDSDRTEEEEYEDEDALEDESVDLPDPEPRTSHTGEEVESTAKDNNANVNVRSDARPKWKGTELFPPQKGSSKVWEHGGFRKNERGQLEADKTVCSHCGLEQSYKGSPSNFDQHLKNAHKIYCQDDKSSASQSKMTQFVSQKVNPYKDTHPVQIKFRQNLLRWIIASKRPFIIVEDEGLKVTIHDLDPRVTVPARSTITRDIIKLYNKKRQATIINFKSVEHFSCTNDAGTSLAGQSFIEVSVHWVDEDFIAKKKIIAVVYTKSKQHGPYRDAVDKALRDHGIISKTFSFTTDNEPTMRKTFSPEERNGCMAHIESKGCFIALDSVKRLVEVRKKFRKLATKAHHSPQFKGRIKDEQASRNIPQLVLRQEVKTRFTATRDMFDSIVLKKKDHDADEEVALKNMESINAALSSSVKKEVFAKQKLERSDIKVAMNVLPLLDILEEGIRLLGGELYATGSVVLPFLSKFLDALEPEEEDVIYVLDFKERLKKEMIQRCYDNVNMRLLLKCSFLDKRFSQLKFVDKLKKHTATVVLDKKEKIERKVPLLNITKETILKDIRDELSLITNVEATEGIRGESPKKKKKKFMDFDEEEIEENIGVEKELENYQAEASLKFSEDTFSWWRNRKSSYPKLAILARKYLSVQGTSTPAERVFSMMGNVLTKKRMSMADKNFSMIMYLSDCI